MAQLMQPPGSPGTVLMEVVMLARTVITQTLALLLVGGLAACDNDRDDDDAAAADSVAMDTVAQIQSHLIAHQYGDLIKKAKLKGGKRR